VILQRFGLDDDLFLTEKTENETVLLEKKMLPWPMKTEKALIKVKKR
jgi:hypothetical protein